MKHLLSLILVLALVLSFGMVSFAEPETLFLGYANHNSDENSNVQMQAFCDTCDAWNEAGNTPVLKYTTTTAEGNLDRQLADIETMVTMGCDAIYIHAIDFVGILPAIENCLANGVKVMEARGVEHEPILSYKVGNEHSMAEMMYKYLSEQLDANPELILNAGLLYGNAAQTAQLVRVDDCVALLEENYPGRINVLASQPCDWDTQKAQDCMENWMQKYQGTMNCIITAAGMMTCGAYNAIVASGEDMSQWYFATVDSTNDILHVINQKQSNVMTVGIDCYRAGQEAVEVMVKYVQGEIENGEYQCNPMVNIDATNIDQWYTE